MSSRWADISIPNLDAIDDVTDLLDLSEALTLLAQYCAKKADAVWWRKSGYPHEAMAVERQLDEIYKKLPQDWRW